MMSRRNKIVAAALLLLLADELDEEADSVVQTDDETEDEDPPQHQVRRVTSLPKSSPLRVEEETASLAVEVGEPVDDYLPGAEQTNENANDEGEDAPLYVPRPRKKRRRRRSSDSSDEYETPAGSSEKRKRRFWSQKLYLQRDRLPDQPPEGIPYLDPTEDLKTLRMSKECFETLLELVSPLIAKRHTAMREAISPKQRLVAVLRYLATGQSHEHLKFSTLLSPSLMGVVLPETCQAIIQVLSKYMRFPENKEDWQQIARGFTEDCQFPNCGGSLNARHINIVKRIGKQGNINHKGYCSVVLATLVDSKYQFVSAEVIVDERESDESAISTTQFYEKLYQDSLSLPDNNETEGGLDFVFISPNSFPPHGRVLTTYPIQQLDEPTKIIFNDQVRSVDSYSDNALGLMASRFGVLRTSMNMQMWKVDLVVRACCALHNFLSVEGRSEYISDGTYDHRDGAGNVILGEWRNGDEFDYSPLELTTRHSLPENIRSREQYAEYFYSFSYCN